MGMADHKAIEAAAFQLCPMACKVYCATCVRKAQAAITAYLAALEAEGFVVVPVEPTEAMMQAGWIASGPHPEECPDDIYRTMIAARPQVKGNGNG